MLGVFGAMLSSACFGFSRSLPAMLISRSLAGALSGNVAVVSSVLSELTDETNQGKGEYCTSFDLVERTFAEWLCFHIHHPRI